MRIGVVGKGGVGKTTVSSLVSRAYVAQGRRVVAVDTDSNPNLALSFGLDEETAAMAPLVPRWAAVGLGVSQGGGMEPFELLERYGLATPAGVTLLHAMRVEHAAAGCMCGGHSTVKSLLSTTLADAVDVAVVDMEGGLEHMVRVGGTLAHADVFLVVMEPTRKSVLTAARTCSLARDLGIRRVLGIGNKARLPADEPFFRAVTAEYEVPLAAVVPFDSAVNEADRHGGMVRLGPVLNDALRALLDHIEPPEVQHQALMVERERILRRLHVLEGS